VTGTPPGRRIVLGVAGGIAAYKAASLVRLFTENGHDVTVVPTASALRFVGAPTWEALSGKPVANDVWSDVAEVPHVRIGQAADLVIVAPATADLVARAAAGLADDLLSTTLLTASCPVVLAPAMHTEMWQHPATQANISTLLERGVHVIPPASGRLTGADTGPGRLPEPEELYAACLRLLEAGAATGAEPGVLGRPLAGRRVVVSAGGTREPLDPVRYLGNRSSGRQGYALAAVAAARGAEVTLVSANAGLPVPDGVDVVPVGTALELQAAVEEAAEDADVVIMAAAVADFRPKSPATTKIKKSHDVGPDGGGGAAPTHHRHPHTHKPDGAARAAPTIELVRNPDILARLVESRGDAKRPLIVGFAAETGDGSASVLEHARAKLARKGCDLLVANEVGDGLAFGLETNTVHLLFRSGLPGAPEDRVAGPALKDAIAADVWDGIQAIL